MLYKISKLIANKKKYVINVVISLFVLIAIAISVIGSYSLFQYQSMNENFQNNEFAKTITTICYYDKHTHNQRALDNNVLGIIKNLFKNENFTIFADYEIHFGLSSDNGDGFFIKTFTENLLVGDIKDYQLVTNTKFNYETITLNIPIVNEEEGGFSSNALVQKDFTIKTVNESSPLNKYIGRNIAIVSYKTFKEIVEIMF